MQCRMSATATDAAHICCDAIHVLSHATLQAPLLYTLWCAILDFEGFDIHESPMFHGVQHPIEVWLAELITDSASGRAEREVLAHIPITATTEPT
eukprot:1022-Heterococcus_DN1.PRE.6